MEVGTAPRLSFTRCPPGFRQTRQTLVSPLLRPRRNVRVTRVIPPLAIPPLPPRAHRPTLALRLRAALFAATGIGVPDCGAQRL